jgi:hypothetical protein
MKRLTFVGLFLGISAIPLEGFAITPSAFAQEPLTAPENTQIAVSLYRGQGITLNFRPTGETIQRAWLDDPSQTTLDFDDANCSTSDTEGCAASVIHLRRIEPINFPGLPTASTTSLTVLTNNGLYSFRLTFPDSGSPSYSVLNIQPESTNVAGADSSSTVAPMTQSEGLATIEQGLNIALEKGLIATDDSLWQRTQTFLSLMREGLSSQVAARQSGVSQDLIIRLAEMEEQTQNLAI